MGTLLADIYPWVKAGHVASVIAWMAGIFYLPRLFVYHAERGDSGSETYRLLITMETKLYTFIMNPALAATWLFGILLVLTPGVIDWGQIWPWIKMSAVVAMTWFHYWLGLRRKDFAFGRNKRSGKRYRIMNELPTLLMLVIVTMVIVKPF